MQSPDASTASASPLSTTPPLTPIKSFLQKLLRSAGLYHRLRGSIWYDLYWCIADRAVLRARANEVTFFRKILGELQPGTLIFDIGANLGHKTDIFLRMGARVIAVDPDTTNRMILQERFLDWRLRAKSVTIVAKAVSDSNGLRTFWVDQPGSAKNTLTPKWVDALRKDSSRFGERLTFSKQYQVESITLDSLIATYGTPAFIKIDVEGHEPEVLRGLHQAVPGVSFEVNLPEFKSEAIECVSLLAALDPQGRFNFTSDCEIGLQHNEWLTRDAFLASLDRCTAPSIEVLWRSSTSTHQPLASS